MNMPQLRKKVRFSFEGKNLSLFELKAMILEGESFFKIEKQNEHQAFNKTIPNRVLQ